VDVVLVTDALNPPFPHIRPPPLHRKPMNDYNPTTANVTRREVSSWPIGQPFPLWPRMQEVTLEAIMRVVFAPVETETFHRPRHLPRALTN
jgi:cytochrome P450